MRGDLSAAAPTGGSERLWRWVAAGVAGAAVLVIAALIVIVVQANRARDTALAAKQHSYDVLIVIGALDASLARAEAALGRFVIDGDRRTGTSYYDEWRRAGGQLDRLASLTRGNPAQVPLLAELRQVYEERGRELAKPANNAFFRKGWPALSLFARAGKSDTIPRTARLLASIAANERTLFDERAGEAAATVARSNRLVMIVSSLGLLLVIAAGVLGWLAVNAMADKRSARAAADEESDRAGLLEQAVATRTRELSEANAQLKTEAANRAHAEAQLRQVQKMEAVGQLTGGIAHDFNNMLAVVLGGLELARRRMRHETEEVGRHIDNAMEGANRAAALTRRLLSFARNEPLLPAGLDPGAMLAGMSDLVDRTIGERIAVRIETPPGLWPIWADAYQLENAILNLAVNARDAMDGSGTLTMAAGNVTLARGEVADAPAGDYVRIAITDDGAGMSPAVLERVFEPFFTTKPPGQGTGLGLSQVFGFARQSGGEIAIQSREGAGTTVAIYLPRHREAATAAPEPSRAAPVAASGKGEVIVVVEDDPRVRNAAHDALAELGYRPVTCSGADEAFALLDERSDVALLITDVVMPGISGPELVERLRPRHPDLAILFVTGYVGEAGNSDQMAGHAVLRKPYTIGALAGAVGTALKPAPAERAA